MTAVRSTQQALSMQIYAGQDSSVGYTSCKKLKILVDDSDLSNFFHVITTPHGAQIVVKVQKSDQTGDWT